MTKYIPLTTADPGTFSYTEGQTYYNEKLAHEILKHAAVMADEGFEIAFDLPDTFDYTSLWAQQTATLTALSSALAVYANVPEFQPFYTEYAGQLGALTTLPFSTENFAIRTAAIAAISAFVQSNAGATLEIPQPLQILQARPAFPAAAWTQQTAAIAQQTATLTRIQAILQEKYDKIPEQAKEPGYFQSLIDWILNTIADEFFWTAVKLLFKGALFSATIFGVAVIGVLAVKDLVSKIFKSIEECSQMIAENNEIQAIEIGVGDDAKAWDYFNLRETILQRHQRDIHNMLTEILAMEAKVKESVMEPNENSSVDLSKLVEAIEGLQLGDLSDLVQAVKDLQYNGQTYWFKDGSKLELQGQTPVESD